ncbi:Lipase 3 [Phytophthora ramorum]|uniref:Lipase 3 n=1 Tax=Phytophthora ramorum TaxID=164328 RepID=UPI00309CDF78|nr:Lipase 3 [Phytophthora ramorum]
MWPTTPRGFAKTPSLVTTTAVAACIPLGLSLCSTAICKNKAKYGTFKPTAYSLGDMVYPRTALYVGAGDTLTEPADLERLRSSLPSGTVMHDMTINIYSHLDFIWAYNANEYVYQDLLAQMAEYDTKPW